LLSLSFLEEHIKFQIFVVKRGKNEFKLLFTIVTHKQYLHLIPILQALYIFDFSPPQVFHLTFRT